MQTARADTVWSLMEKGKYYSIRDLANITGQPISVVEDIVKLIAKDGFVKQMGTNQPLFTRSSVIISPALAKQILECAAKHPSRQLLSRNNTRPRRPKG